MPRSFLDDHRWDLCKSFLERADRSADVSRSLLFTASAAGTGFSILQMGDGSRYHLVAAALFAFAVAVLYLSWDRQKLKARERFRLLRDEGVAAYVENEKKVPSNRRLDWMAFCSLVIAVIIEGVLAYVDQLSE
jgi:hypothetical protein